jgi:hypothetical protein
MSDLAAIPSISIESRSVFGNKRIVIGTITFGDGSSTWPDGGLSFVGSQIGLNVIEAMFIEPNEMSYWYDKDNNKIDAFVPASTTGADKILTAAIGAVPTAVATRFIAIGHGG